MTCKLENRVLRKITLRIVPFIMLLYFIAFLDRVNIGFAALTMNEELGFSPTVFGFGAGIFFIGYFLCEVPSNLILHKVGARIWIARVMITWGLVSGAMAFVQGTTSFYTLRFLLGVAEAGFFPGIILYLSYWFPAQRRAQVTAIFMAAAPLSTALGSPISGALLEMHGLYGFSGWQWMFVLEAVPALILGVVVLFYLTDRPEKAKWLNDEEREWLTTTMAAEQARRPQQGHQSVWRGLADKRVLALALVYFGTSAGLYTLGIWSPQIIKSFGMSALAVGFINAIPAVLAVGAMVWWARHSDRHNERTWHVIAACLLAALGLVFAGLSGSLVGVILALVLVNIGISCSKPPLWSMPTLFLSGSAAAAGIATINSIGNLGGFVGPTIIGVIKHQTGSYTNGLWFVAALLVFSALLVLWLSWSQRRMQRTDDNSTVSTHTLINK
ncbi:MFS transporter [Erwiniaceae bacterium BAC15a-03b]|uniref:Putative tartrate transporter n=1 Tax=Winslowiella arboricola TaxID=2978220 RepID=A0A9J6PX34_9GAMM|nr:MFS transporter [Winslowiella arboricola]MCU5774800.1 MFS transporter [Winslowiella arboricola]MCU5780048.1 MFS transporter [Winslowiella arboricola]